MHRPRFGEAGWKPEKSAYYYWYAFLREVDDDEYANAPDMWEDFGYVKNMTFEEWWLHTEELFADSNGLMEAAFEANEGDENKDLADAGYFLVAINRSASRNWIDECVGKILDSKSIKSGKGNKMRRKEDEVKTGKYVFHKVPNVEMLEVILLTYQYHKAGMKLLSIPAVLKKVHEIDVSAGCSDPDNLLKKMSGYNRDAEKIRDNVLEGRFPDY